MKYPYFKTSPLLLFLSLFFANQLFAAVSFTISPSTVSNTYPGNLTLQITGLTNTETVTVQKFLDLNTNGVIDATDYLVQQFNLTDGQAGQVIGGVTNLNVPGDTNATGGQITSAVRFRLGDFTQNIIGQYLVRLSSPVAHFTAITNAFTVTNASYSQTITGTVLSNTVPVGNAVILIFPYRGANHGPGTPVAGVVANSAGSYTVRAPTGTYQVGAFKSNYLSSFASAFTVTNNASYTNNPQLTNATISLIGRLVDAVNTNIPLPGLFGSASANGMLAITFNDTNGYAALRVQPGQWKIGNSDNGLIVHGYVGYQNSTNIDASAGSVSNLVFPISKATALFYGTVKDTLGNPLPGLDLFCDENYGIYEMDGYTDANGNYAIGAVGGISGDNWGVEVDNGNNSSIFTNYIFSQSTWQQNGGTNINVGQAVRQDFTAVIATNFITGHVQKSDGSSFSGVTVSASATIGTNSFQSQGTTDSSGNYSILVANGSWSVNVLTCCGDDSLDQILGNGNYVQPNSQNVAINNNNNTANFTVQLCASVTITTTNLPSAQINTEYDQYLQASSCSGSYSWTFISGSLDSGITLYDSGELYGTPVSSGTNTFTVQVNDGTHTSTQSYTLIIAGGPLQVTTASLPNGTNGTVYSKTIQASGGLPPYSWVVPNYSANPPANLSLSTNGILSGTLAVAVTNSYFDVQVTDALNNTASQTLSLTVVNPPAAPLVITNSSFPNGNVGALYSTQLGATGGQTPYTWALALGSASLPGGLSLNSSGLISGTATNSGLFNFKVQVTDVNSTKTNKVLGIIVNPGPVLKVVNWLPNQFQMQLTGASNQGYTVQTTTNIGSTNWTALLFTNNTVTNSFMVIDPAIPTNKQRFYRVLIGP